MIRLGLVLLVAAGCARQPPRSASDAGLTAQAQIDAARLARAWAELEQGDEALPDRPQAERHYREAMSLTGPGEEVHKRAKERLAALKDGPGPDARARAKEEYLQGYMLKDTDPAEAAKHFRAAMALVPPDDGYSIKAKMRLAELRR